MVVPPSHIGTFCPHFFVFLPLLFPLCIPVHLKCHSLTPKSLSPIPSDQTLVPLMFHHPTKPVFWIMWTNAFPVPKSRQLNLMDEITSTVGLESFMYVWLPTNTTLLSYLQRAGSNLYSPPSDSASLHPFILTQGD